VELKVVDLEPDNDQVRLENQAIQATEEYGQDN